MLVYGQLTPYEYNFLKNSDEMDQLNQTIDVMIDTGIGLSDIKRSHPTFCKSKILDTLHERGLKYKPFSQERRVPLL